MIVAFYGRVSTEEQADRGNIESQVDFAKKFFDLDEKAGGVIENHIFYLDDGVSGISPLQERPAGSKLLADAELGKFEAVFVYRLDRLARSVKIVLDTYEYLEKLNITLKSMTEAYDTGTATGKFFMTLLASVGDLERETILERTLLGKERAVKENRWTSGPPPFGYRVGLDKRLVVHESESDTVRLIFKLYNEGLTTVPIAEYLNALGIPTPVFSKRSKNKSSGRWGSGQISLILKNQIYTGEYQTMRRSKKQREGRVINIPPIVSKEEFNKVRRLAVMNSDAVLGARSSREYLLRGLIYCQNCGQAFIGSTGGGAKRSYYRCAGTKNQGRGKACNAKMIVAGDIEGAVWRDVQGFLNNLDKVVKEIKNIINNLHNLDYKPVKKGEIEVIEKTLLKKQGIREKIRSFITRKVISDQEAENELLNLTSQIDVLYSRKSDLYARLTQSPVILDDEVNDSKIIEIFMAAVKDSETHHQAELIRAVVNRVSVQTLFEGGRKESRVGIEYLFDPKSCPDLGFLGDA